MAKGTFNGVYSAIFSIYNENLNVKFDAVQKLVDYQLAGGVKGFYVCGNTGECAVLPVSTRKQMLEAVVKANRGRGQIMAHIGATSIDQTKELLEHANGMDIDAISSLQPAQKPYYRTPEILEYYRWLAENSKHPVYAYVTPDMQGSPVEIAKEFEKIDNIAGIKLTNPDYFSFGAVMREFKGKLNVLNGPDETMICGLAVGADGAIGTTYNLLPKVSVAIYENFMAGNVQKALESQQKLNRVIELAISGNIAYWKAILGVHGFDVGHTVFPRKLPTEQELAELKAKLDEIGFADMM